MIEMERNAKGMGRQSCVCVCVMDVEVYKLLLRAGTQKGCFTYSKVRKKKNLSQVAIFPLCSALLPVYISIEQMGQNLHLTTLPAKKPSPDFLFLCGRERGFCAHLQNHSNIIILSYI